MSKRLLFRKSNSRAMNEFHNHSTLEHNSSERLSTMIGEVETIPYNDSYEDDDLIDDDIKMHHHTNVPNSNNDFQHLAVNIEVASRGLS